MLTELKFKNWRSLRDVTIDGLTPITVFIGANSSGKSNLLDALHFVRYAKNAGDSQAASEWHVKENVRTIGVKMFSPVELDLTSSANETGFITQKYTITFQGDFTRVEYGEMWQGPDLPAERKTELFRENSNVVALRWQLFGEGFIVPLMGNAEANSISSDLYIIAPSAKNVPIILNFMQQSYPEIYHNLEADLQHLLGYVSQLGTVNDDRGTRYFLEEKSSLGHESPTISSGTTRLIAMLTAYYALDMRSPELPGLIVIEEPDTAINPLLLRDFVELLRTYTERKDRPRQFILTTHNPLLLNWFQPEEVRVVERDPETGDTSAEKIPDYIREIWLERHKLGDAWLNRVIGGIPQE